MRVGLLFALFLLVTSHATAHADESQVAVFPSRTFVLANGLDVYLEHDTTQPTVSVVMGYSAGSREDPVDRQGLAHLTEHVTYQGTRDLGEDAMIATLERVGVTGWNGITAHDFTQYYATAPRESVSALLWVEAQRMAYVLSHADVSTVSHQVRIVQREWFERVGDHAGSARASVLGSALFAAHHPYANDSASPRETGTLTLEDVQWFHQTFYRPSRARLAVVGDVELDEAERLVRLLFEGIVDRGPARPRAGVQFAPATADRTIILRAPVQTSTLTFAWVTPAYFEPYDAELDVIAQLLCADESAVLASEIVRNRQIALEVHCYQGSRALASIFAIEVALGDQRQRSAIPIAVDEVLAVFASRSFDAAAIEAARRKNVERVISHSRSAIDRARAAANFMLSPNAPITRFTATADVARYQAVTAASLAEAVRYLVRTGRVIMLTVPDAAAPDEGVVVTDIRSEL